MGEISIREDASGGALQVSFSKRGFADFLVDLMSAKREDRKLFAVGFDLEKPQIKSLVERVLHHVRAQFDLISEDIKITVQWVNSSDRTWASADQFFAEDHIRPERVVMLSISFAFVIGFRNVDGSSEEKRYERQSVAIEFGSGRRGSIYAKIQSTEITWAPGILKLIEDQVQIIARPSLENEWWSKFLPFAALFRDQAPVNNDIFYFREMYSRQRARYLISMLTGGLFGMMMILLLAQSQTLNVPMYNPATGQLEEGEFQNYVDSVGWEEASRLALLSGVMKKSNLAEYREGDRSEWPALDFIVSFVSLRSLIAALLIFAFIVANARHGAALDLASEGRISLGQTLPPRKHISPFSGLLFASSSAILIGLLVEGMVQVASLP